MRVKQLILLNELTLVSQECEEKTGQYLQLRQRQLANISKEGPNTLNLRMLEVLKICSSFVMLMRMVLFKRIKDKKSKIR